MLTWPRKTKKIANSFATESDFANLTLDSFTRNDGRGLKIFCCGNDFPRQLHAFQPFFMPRRCETMRTGSQVSVNQTLQKSAIALA